MTVFATNSSWRLCCGSQITLDNACMQWLCVCVCAIEQRVLFCSFAVLRYGLFERSAICKVVGVTFHSWVLFYPYLFSLLPCLDAGTEIAFLDLSERKTGDGDHDHHGLIQTPEMPLPFSAPKRRCRYIHRSLDPSIRPSILDYNEKAYH